eukprot:679631-Rhodomonas_salina.2
MEHQNSAAVGGKQGKLIDLVTVSSISPLHMSAPGAPDGRPSPQAAVWIARSMELCRLIQSKASADPLKVREL